MSQMYRLRESPASWSVIRDIHMDTNRARLSSSDIVSRMGVRVADISDGSIRIRRHHHHHLCHYLCRLYSRTQQPTTADQVQCRCRYRPGRINNRSCRIRSRVITSSGVDQRSRINSRRVAPSHLCSKRPRPSAVRRVSECSRTTMHLHSGVEEHCRPVWISFKLLQLKY